MRLSLSLHGSYLGPLIHCHFNISAPWFSLISLLYDNLNCNYLLLWFFVTVICYLVMLKNFQNSCIFYAFTNSAVKEFLSPFQIITIGKTFQRFRLKPISPLFSSKRILSQCFPSSCSRVSFCVWIYWLVGRSKMQKNFDNFWSLMLYATSFL